MATLFSSNCRTSHHGSCWFSIINEGYYIHLCTKCTSIKRLKTISNSVTNWYFNFCRRQSPCAAPSFAPQDVESQFRVLSQWRHCACSASFFFTVSRILITIPCNLISQPFAVFQDHFLGPPHAAAAAEWSHPASVTLTRFAESRRWKERAK